VAVAPTEAEYSFGRESGAGPGGTARTLTSTYIEYVKSRPVVEAAFEKLGAKSLESDRATGLTWPVQLVKDAVRGLSSIYRMLDSGRSVRLSPRDAALQKLSDAIALETVADSYILRIEVGLSDPKVAAAAANALAEAYVGRVTEQLENSVGEIGGFIKAEITARESEVAALRASEDRLNAGVGSASLEEERNSVVRARELERQKLNDAQVQLDAAESQLALLTQENPLQSGRSLAELSSARAAAEALRDGAKKSITLRQETSRGLNATLDALKQKEEPLLAVQRRLAVVTEELTQLHSRLLSTDLTRSSSLTRVSVIDPAVAPIYPSSPHVIANTVLGGLAGLIASLMLVIVLDTTSGTVKTGADLRRIGGARSLGAVPRDLLSLAHGLTPRRRSRLLVKLRAFGADAERGLTKLDAFDFAAIQMSGLADARRQGRTAIALASALASRGRKAACFVGEDAMPTNHLAELTGDGVSLLASAGSESSKHSIRIECLAPLSSEWRFSKAVKRSPVLVFLVPAGEVQEQDVRDFLEAALRSGVSAFALLLVEAP